MEFRNNELHELEDWEARAFIQKVLERADCANAQPSTGKDEFAGQIVDMWTAYVQASRERKREADERRNCIHLLFGLSDAGSLKVALSNAGMRQASEVLAFNDLFSIGPVGRLETTDGQRHRQHWLTERFAGYMHDQLFNREHGIGAMLDRLAGIPERQNITIWCADNAHAQVGLRLALYALRERTNPICTVNITQAYAKIALHHESELIPAALGEISLEAIQELLMSKEWETPLPEEERRRYEREWLELSGGDGLLRLWRDGKLLSVQETYFDESLMGIVKRLQDEEGGASYIRAGRIVGEAIAEWKQLVGDLFVEYRLWTLISDGKLVFKGLPGAVYKFSVKLTSS
ncbi:DUF1835 domain-containing protein [Paenibacillus sp. MBLB4367]|uniref:DUF1835 domain-containing protein n=1 Tax=Paenibacillus sp. MBLB4367 TaxID=3384767 RepID=UPI0039082CA8